VTRRTALLRLAVLAALLAGAFAAVAASGALSAERVRDGADGYGVAGPLVFIAVSSALTLCLFPGPLLAGASGLLFGTALGTPVAIVASTVGATLAFLVARYVAHDAVEALQGRRLAALRAWVGAHGFRSVLYARIAPGVPYHLVNYAAGLSPVALRAFVPATAIGCAPRAFAYAALGGSIDDLGAPEAIVAFVVLGLMAVLGLVVGRRAATTTPAAPGSETGSCSPGGRWAGRP
jgi:uncharacterized membrane protein YdjX (TVP38/TMEM64 family)